MSNTRNSRKRQRDNFLAVRKMHTYIKCMKGLNAVTSLFKAVRFLAVCFSFGVCLFLLKAKVFVMVAAGEKSLECLHAQKVGRTNM